MARDGNGNGNGTNGNGHNPEMQEEMRREAQALYKEYRKEASEAAGAGEHATAARLQLQMARLVKDFGRMEEGESRSNPADDACRNLVKAGKPEMAIEVAIEFGLNPSRSSNIHMHPTRADEIIMASTVFSEGENLQLLLERRKELARVSYILFMAAGGVHYLDAAEIAGRYGLQPSLQAEAALPAYQNALERRAFKLAEIIAFRYGLGKEKIDYAKSQSNWDLELYPKKR